RQALDGADGGTGDAEGERRPQGIMKAASLAAALATALAALSASAQVQFQKIEPGKDPFSILRNRPDSESPEIIANLVRDRNRVPPPYLYELARRLWPTDHNGAFEWFALGMI